MCFPVSHLFSLLLCDKENQVNQKGFGDAKLFDFSGWHHLREQMAKHVTGLEGDSKIKKVKKRQTDRQGMQWQGKRWVSVTGNSLWWDSDGVTEWEPPLESKAAHNSGTLCVLLAACSVLQIGIYLLSAYSDGRRSLILLVEILHAKEQHLVSIKLSLWPQATKRAVSAILW